MRCKKDTDGTCGKGCVLNPATRRCIKKKVGEPKHTRNYKPSKPSPPKAPTAVPTKAPTAVPTKAPTAVPTKAPTAVPTKAPTAVPTKALTGKVCDTVDDDQPLKYSLKTLMPYLGLMESIPTRSRPSFAESKKPNPSQSSNLGPTCRRGMLPDSFGAYPPDVDPTVGDYHDIMCVAMGSKYLAAFDQTKYGKRLTRTNGSKNLARIRDIIRLATDAGVQIMTIKKKTRNYMKSVAFKPKHQSNALKLLLILHGIVYPQGTETEADVVYFVGKLLGYDVANVITYIKQNNDKRFSPSDALRCNKLLNKFNIRESDYTNLFVIEKLSGFKP